MAVCVKSVRSEWPQEAGKRGSRTATIVECSHLGKTYPSGATGLHDLLLSIEAGESFALLGENGAGKSTLVRLLLGFMRPSAGAMRLLGESDVRRARYRVGYVLERQVVDPRLGACRYLGYLAELTGLAFFRSSAEETRAIVQEDPAVKAGIDAYQIVAFVCPKGAIALPHAAHDRDPGQ